MCWRALTGDWMLIGLHCRANITCAESYEATPSPSSRRLRYGGVWGVNQEHESSGSWVGRLYIHECKHYITSLPAAPETHPCFLKPRQDVDQTMLYHSTSARRHIAAHHPNATLTSRYQAQYKLHPLPFRLTAPSSPSSSCPHPQLSDLPGHPPRANARPSQAAQR